MVMRLVIVLVVLVLISQDICGQRRGRNSRRRTCKTSRGDRGRCMSPRECWYKGNDLFEDDNICEHDYYYPLYCCPSDENDVEKVSIRTPARRNTGSKACKTSRGDRGQCMSARNCWYKGRALFEHDNICEYDFDDPLYCCPPNEDEVINVSARANTADARCEEYSRLGDSFRSRENNIFSSEITLGVKSSTKEFPHMAVLGYGSIERIEWKCGGSLISDQFVLTAAHCLRSTSSGEVKIVRLGDLDLKSEEDSALPQQFTVSRRIAHPQYRSDSQYHDVGLLKLDSPVKYTSYVRPGCLDTSSNLIERKFIATGWGSVEFAGSNSDILQKVDLDYFPDERCAEVFGPQRQLDNGVNITTQLCAGGYDNGKDTCQGDSGGPLQVRLPGSSNLYKIVGITSFGKGCGLEKVPGVYTRVSYYVSWIEGVVWS